MSCRLATRDRTPGTANAPAIPTTTTRRRARCCGLINEYRHAA